MQTYKSAIKHAVEVVALLAIFSAVPVHGQGAAITGAANLSLIDDSGAPVVAASVSIHKGPKVIERFKGPTTIIAPGPNARASLTPDSNGRLSAPALEPGEYGVCVIAPATIGIVSPCRWYGVWRIIITPGKTTTVAAFVLHKGGVLRVHIMDGQHLLPHPDSLVMPAFSIGLLNAAGNYVGMKADEQVTAAGRDYTTIVPLNSALRLQVFSRKVRFADQAGAELLNGGNIPVTLSSGQSPKDINITVIGKINVLGASVQ